MLWNGHKDPTQEYGNTTINVFVLVSICNIHQNQLSLENTLLDARKKENKLLMAIIYYNQVVTILEKSIWKFNPLFKIAITVT